ncbi:hypothetical protein JHL18_20545 [Clostridium sp. YIM B02505]|uniref:Nucleotidyltransferase n=1 Tax=Clostridium yunnanense TaxID=2800325 RepID=A0ABS1EUG8_9CLOT|nr:hypothetical protein [Clostridium yunnanense]MBK1813017.1 hypothetical protein [Clostridium yunnanense]
MNINKEVMEQEARSFLSVLFTLPEVEKVQIKDIFILSIYDNTNIRKGLDECYHDKYSDVDINVYLRLHPNDYYDETPIYKKHFSRLGIQDRIFGIVFQERIDDKEGMRICLNNGVRIDFSCFCRCDETIELLNYVQTAVEEDKKLACRYDLKKSDWFWFVAVQALGKLMRKDYLISSHLAHMLIMEGLVTQMIIRDNQYNTNFHRYGYSEQLEYLKVDMNYVNEFKIHNDETHNHITELLYRAVVSYDKSILRLNDRYVSRSELFLEIWREYIKLEAY